MVEIKFVAIEAHSQYLQLTVQPIPVEYARGTGILPVINEGLSPKLLVIVGWVKR